LAEQWRTHHRPEPPASVRANRPALAAEAGSAGGQTNEKLDAMHAWHATPWSV